MSKAYKIIQHEQGSNAWKDWRREGVTATDAVVIAGASPYKTYWRLWAEKTGYCAEIDLSGNPLVRRGHELEDVARQAAELQMNDMLIPVCVESVRWPWVRASLDGLNSRGEPVELKNPSELTWQEVKSTGEQSLPYRMYRIQVLHQMLALGATRGWLVFHFNGELVTFEIAADMTIMGQMLRDSVEFTRRVEERDEPEKDEMQDWFIPEGEEAETWIALCQAYRSLDAQAAELKQKVKLIGERQKELSHRLQGMMGGYRTADYGGLQITRYTVTQTDYKQMLEDGVLDEADTAKYTKESERCRVTVNPDSVMPKYVKDDDAVAPLKGVASTPIVGF